jgi:alpha-L-rhamnosidase
MKLAMRRRICLLAVFPLLLSILPTTGPASARTAPAQTGPDLTAGQWIGVSDPASSWSAYTVSVNFTIAKEAASVYFRAQGGAGNSYMWQVNVTGPVPVLKKHVWVNGGVASVTEVPIANVIPEDAIHAPHTMSITARSNTITTSIDGVLVDTAQDPTYTKGTIGFRESPTEDATYRDLVVTSSTGEQLLNDPFTVGDPNRFSAGSITANGLDVSNASAMLLPQNQTPRLRNEFTLGKPVRSAQLYASALGLYELDIDSARVGNDLFAPGWTNYRDQIQYQTYDVTRLLRRGANAIAGQLAPGWYSGDVGWFGGGQYGSTPALWAQLHVTYSDGSTQVIATDSSWNASTAGPVTSADNYMGESYDARNEQPGWTDPGFAGTGWAPVDVLPTESSKLLPQIGPAVRVTGTVNPVGVTEPTPGTYVYNLGQDLSGVVRLRVRGPAGTTVRLQHAQALNPDGTLYTANLAAGPAPYLYASQTDTFTLRGGIPETFQPQFTYHGFQYVAVTGYPGRPTLADLTGVVEGTDAPVIGNFATSDSMINQLQSNITWSERDNLFSVPTDTNARTERLGWAGDADFFAPTAVFNRNLDGFYNKWERDVIDSQTPDGVFGNVAPIWSAPGGYGGGWGDVGVVLPYTTWQSYGDIGIVRNSYAAMQKYISAMQSMSAGLILPAGFAPAGDWMNVAQSTPSDLIATAYFAYDTSLMAQMAAAIGRTADAAAYRALFQQIVSAWDAKYVSPDGTIAGDTQTDYVLALHLDLMPTAQRTAAADRLVDSIRSSGMHLATGFVGTQWLLPVLTASGHTDVAYALLEQTTYPSWGYEILHGATTIWERWDGIQPDGTFNPNTNGNSFNHAVDGAVGIWMYQTIAGIVPDPTQPGYRHFSVHPEPGGGLTHASASLKSPYGSISSAWQDVGHDRVFTIDVPRGTTATIDIPATTAGAVVGGGSARFQGFANGYASYSAGRGHYTFISRGEAMR